MIGDPSAYAALGLRPGASRAQVDEAYRRLIKLHHPDRAGGDGGRAAEINRAYTVIRRAPPNPAPRPRAVVVTGRAQARTPGRASFLWVIALGGIVAAGLLANKSHERRTIHVVRSIASALPVVPDPSATAPEAPDLFEEPLRPAIIANAIAAAVEFHANGDIAGAVNFSRDCSARFSETRDLGWFDACAAFDEAAAAVEEQSGAVTSERFNDVAVITREMTAARALSNDMLAAESRLRQIRSQVEIQLAASLQGAAAPVP